MSIKLISKQTGFTLIELLTVLLILAALTSVTLDFTKDFAFQGRYEVTKDRYEKIKRAIIGRPDVLINGQPDISGFVADMGRLPLNIHELLVENYCAPDYSISESNSNIPLAHAGNYQLWCETDHSAGDWIQQGVNWKGPYLTLQKPDYLPNAFPDGWGNIPTGLTDQNYGWAFCLGEAPDITTANTCHTHTPLNVIANKFRIAVQSKGKNGTINSTDSGYDADYPSEATLPNIKHNDWTVDIDTLQVNVSTPNHGECLNAVCSDPTYGLYTDCIKQLSYWRVGVCDVQSHINTTIGACSGASGGWTELGSCSDISHNTKAICESNSETWTGICSNTLYTTQSSCEQPRGSWMSCSISPSTNLTKTNCDSASGNWESAIENNCQKGGGQWSNKKNICFKVVRGSDSFIPNPPSVINEDSNNHLISYGTSQLITMGDTSISIHPSDNDSCDNNDAVATYPATCINTNSDADFTEANCEGFDGQFLEGATIPEHICINMKTGANGINCTGNASSQLEGLWSNTDPVELKLLPNSSLPTIYW